MELYCIICNSPLSNGLDTFGDAGEEMCWDCWADYLFMTVTDTWYGMAPHHHDLTITGSIIGSTVFTPLPGEPNEYGDYEIEPGLFFRPDPEVNGEQGFWTDNRGGGK